MRLNQKALDNTKQWEEKGYNIPKYDRQQVVERTKESPVWLHLGAGNLFRGFPAMLQHTLLNKNISEKGIVVAEGFDYEIIQNVYKPYENLSLLVTLKSEGTTEKTVVGSIAESLEMNTQNQKDYNRLKDIFKEETLEMVSFTITEKGYSLVDGKGLIRNDVQEDFESGPKKPTSYMGKLTALLYERYKNGASPIALVSMDNTSQNGKLLKNTVMKYVQEWLNNDKIEPGFKDYVTEPSKVSFPWSMIDKITPRPNIDVKKELEDDGFEDTEIQVTSRNSHIAPFVNAEEIEYLVIEDKFPNGRPKLEEAGVIFTDRKTVDKAETMKVTSCLNPLHTTLAIFGCLLGHTSVHETMKDEELSKLVEKVGYQEGLPVAIDPGIIDPKKFIDEVVNIRFPNPYMPDTPQRIITDTSQKIPIRFGKTIQAYVENEELDVDNLEFIPLVLAGWIRYLIGIDDKGNIIEQSSDPLLDELKPLVENIQLGDEITVREKLRPILKRTDIFGVDLYKIGLAEKIENYFSQLIKEPGAIRSTLQKAL